MDNRPTLSICIPIYNRKSYLERMLSRFLEDKPLFEEKIQLFISDNCSIEDIKGVCNNFLSKGLVLTYSCNAENLGMDGNFANCFNHAKGKYCWVLGSDDIPVQGLLGSLIKILDEGDYGLLHLSIKQRDTSMQIYENHDEMLSNVGYWITYLSGNIIKTDTLVDIDLNQYKGTFISQVPAYLNACCACQNNAIIYQEKFFVGDDDSLNNGGYNIFQVFVTNLYGIYEKFVSNGLLSKQAFEKMTKIEYKEFLVGYIVNLLILGKKGNFKTDNAWSALRKYYANKPYAYYYLINRLVRRCLVGSVKSIIDLFKK